MPILSRKRISTTPKTAQSLSDRSIVRASNWDVGRIHPLAPLLIISQIQPVEPHHNTSPL